MEACRALTRRHEDHPSMPSAGRATERLLKVEGQERRRGRALSGVLNARAAEADRAA